MAMHGDFSPEARERAHDKARAAAVFSDNAEVIVAALPDVPDGHVLVAVVDDTVQFNGMHHVAEDELVARVPELEARYRGWAMVFSPASDIGDVRRRSDEMGLLARRRAEMITRILARRNGI
jgi:hypothetical protein